MVMMALSGKDEVLNESTLRYCLRAASSPRRRVVAVTLGAPPRLVFSPVSGIQPSWLPVDRKVSVFFTGIDEQLARDCQRSGLALYAWTVDGRREMARLIELGVDGICTNFPDKAVALLR